MIRVPIQEVGQMTSNHHIIACLELFLERRAGRKPEDCLALAHPFFGPVEASTAVIFWLFKLSKDIFLKIVTRA